MPSLHRALTIGLAATCWAACSGADFQANTAPTRQTHAVYFPIETGKHDKIGCDDCHGGFGSFRQYNCVNCHDEKQTHDKPSTDPLHGDLTGYTFTSTACFGCHPKGDASLVEFHEPILPIGIDSPHFAQRCEDCHLTESKKAFDCTGCHTHENGVSSIQHRRVAGYRYASPDCYRCHQDGNGLTRDAHASYFPIKAGSVHAESRCAECHPMIGARTAVDCVDCHAHPSDVSLSQHEAVGGYAYVSELCVRCHFDSSVPRVADHLPFAVDSGSHRAANAPCLLCHFESQPKRKWATDFVTFTCEPCHDCDRMNAEHQRRQNYACVATTCVQSGCHPDGGT